MANASTTGFGLRMVMNVGNTPATSGQSEYQIQAAPGVASNKGDPMSTQNASGEQGYQQDASFTTTDDTGAGGTSWTTATSSLLTGVFNGAFFIDANGKPTFANNIVAAQTTSTDYNTGSAVITCFINDNPHQEYVVKADALVGASEAAAQAPIDKTYKRAEIALDARPIDQRWPQDHNLQIRHLGESYQADFGLKF